MPASLLADLTYFPWEVLLKGNTLRSHTFRIFIRELSMRNKKPFGLGDTQYYTDIYINICQLKLYEVGSKNKVDFHFFRKIFIYS